MTTTPLALPRGTARVMAGVPAINNSLYRRIRFSVGDPETYVNRAGDVGSVQRAERGEGRVAELILDGGGVVVMSLWGRGSIGGEDFRLILDGFEPRGSGAH